MLCVSADPGKLMNRIHSYFKLKYDKISEPYMYLGANISKILLEGGIMLWTMFDEKCVKAGANKF